MVGELHILTRNTIQPKVFMKISKYDNNQQKVKNIQILPNLWNVLDAYKSLESFLLRHHLFGKVLLDTMTLATLLTSLIFQLTLTSSIQGSVELERACKYFQKCCNNVFRN